ncbi:MAG: sigma-70 family RNA polymerase sigma factor [Vicinamibacterales bacterium]
MDLDSVLHDLTPRLLRYLRARTGDGDLAEEIAQESLTALVQHWRRRGPPECPEAYVFAIARRGVVRGAIRQRLRVPLDLLFHHQDGRPTPERQVIGRSERDRVLAAIRRLSRREREALLLVVAADLDCARAAAALGVSVSAVKMRVLRARKHLAAMLEVDNAR